MSSAKELLHTAEGVCREMGCSIFELVEGGKHMKFIVRRLNEHRTVTISRSPSCPFVGKKVAADVRRALKELGYHGIKG